MEQVKRLIIEPTKHLDTIGPLVIVIDALDESGDPVNCRHLLRAISKQIADNTLLTNLRFLITTRPETDILTELLPGPQTVRKDTGDIPKHIVDEDIREFVYYSLHQYTELESLWPGQEWC